MKTDVKFDSAGLKLAGNLYTPDGAHAGPRPGIIISHPGSGVKEQAPALYGRQLAELGFVTLTFDAAYQGESEGMPRSLEDPAHRVEDMKAAVSFLSVQANVDPERIGALGICASGGYVISAASTDQRIKAVATASGVDIGRFFRQGPDGTQPGADLQNMLVAAAKARTAEAAGKGVGTFPLFASSEAEARARGPHALEGYEYYCTPRAFNPRSAKALTWSSVDRIAGFDAFRFVDMISPRPLMMVIGTNAVTSWISREAYEAAREPKQLVWIEGASHNDLYDRYVPQVVVKLNEFFTANLPA